MYFFLEKLLTGRVLNQEDRDYLFAQYSKHTMVLAIPGIMSALALILFDYKKGYSWLSWTWLVLMVVLQVVRYFIAKSNLSNQMQYKRLFSLMDYFASGWFVVYLYVSGWQTTSESEVLLKGFFIYTAIVFHLESLRFDLFRLIIHASIACFSIILYVVQFTAIPIDAKTLFSVLVSFGLIMLIYFGRSSHMMALETYDLLCQNQKLIVTMDDMLDLDELTQQYSRRYFNAQLTKHVQQYQHSQQYFSIAIMDIDYFKKINDEYGHDVGDQALVSAAQFVKQHIRNTDIFSRYGGDEFTMIFPLANKEVAERVLNTLRERFVDHAFDLDGIRIPITLSMGVAQVQEGDTEVKIIKRADDALYQAKQAGRNRVKIN